MNRKIRSGIVALAAAIFALAIVIAPTRAMALDGDGTVYSEDGILVYVEDDGAGLIKQELTVNVNVDGEQVGSTTLTGLSQASVTMRVSVAGYTVESIDCSDMLTMTSAGNGVYDVGFGKGGSSSYTATINLVRTMNDIEISDGETVYGTFSWSKPNATDFGWERNVTVRVNGVEEYTTTISTPRILENTTANDQFWFTPNAALFNTGDVEFDRLTLDANANKDLVIDLTTCCPCGSDVCSCPGGADCTCDEGCECDLCAGNLGEDRIATPYGVLGYMADEEGGYNLTVELYVNGEFAEEHVLPRIQNTRNGNLTFEPASGYYYFVGENSYDFITNPGTLGTWDQASGYLEFSGQTQAEKDYPNVLKVYLWTFNNHVNLDVDRLDWVPAGEYNPIHVVTGYTISFDAFDPQTNATRTFTYEATSFSGTQRQIVPTNTKVTLRAMCTPGYEASEWYTEEPSSINSQLIGNEGGEVGRTRDTATGDEAYLTVNANALTDVQVWIGATRAATAPTPDEVVEIVGENGLLVDCVNQYAGHGDRTYSLKADTLSIGEPTENNTKVEVSVTTTDQYVADYVVDMGGENHWLDPEPQTLTFTLEHDGTSWKVADGETPVKLTVNCDAEPAPEPPTTDDVEALLANNAVSITCVNDEVEHESATYGPMDYSYWIGQVTGDAESGYECLVTFASDKYVAAYDETTGADHALAEGEQAQKAIKFVWDAENSAWAVDADANPVNFDVVCETPAPEQPDLPGIDDLPTIFGTQGAVLIDCVNTDLSPAHDDATYDIKAATYGWENYGADDNGQYTVDLRVSPYAYVVDYNAANGAHALTTDSADSKVITLAYDAEDQAWKIAEGQPQQFAFEVICETPQPEEPAVPKLPTDDELQQIFADGLVSVECTTEGVGHELKTYKPIAEGGYAFGEVEGNVEDGATVEMTVFPQAYVGAYEADYDNIPHALNGGQSAAAVRLTYADGAWSVAEDFAPIAYTVFCTTCPVDSTPDAPTIDEVNDLFVDGAVKVTCVNEESGHGSESYELKNGYVTIGNVYGSEAEGWKVDVTAAPGQYVLDFQTAKGVHHTLSPEDQGAQTVTLNFTEDGWALPTADAQFEFTVVCADEAGDNTGDNTGDNSGDNGGDTGNENGGNGGSDNVDGTETADGSNLPGTGDATSVGIAVAFALGGAALAGTAFVARRRQQ